MQLTDHKELVRRLYEEWAPTGDAEAAVEVVSEDFVNHSCPPDMPQGRDNVRAMAELLSGAFSEQRYDVHHEVAEGDTVIVHCTWHAKHTGPFLGLPATNRAISARQTHIFRISDGLIAEHWAVRDDLRMLRQMGVLPE